MAKITQQRNFRVLEKMVDSDKVVFVFTAMGTKIWLYRLFVKLMNNRGYSIVIYDYPMPLVSRAQFEVWEQFYDDILVDGQQRLATHKRAGVRHFYVYGISMGTLIGGMFARETPEVTHVILTLLYGDVATNIWLSPMTWKTRRTMRKQRVPMETLRKHVARVDPIQQAAGLRGKKLLLNLSRRDKILHYSETIKSKQAFDTAGIDMKYVENIYLGHFASGTKHLLSIKKIDNFYGS